MRRQNITIKKTLIQLKNEHIKVNNRGLNK
jgi:hypothetical protein